MVKYVDLGLKEFEPGSSYPNNPFLESNPYQNTQKNIHDMLNSHEENKLTFAIRASKTVPAAASPDSVSKSVGSKWTKIVLTAEQVQNLRDKDKGETVTYSYVQKKDQKSGYFVELPQGSEFAEGQILLLKKEERIHMIKVQEKNMRDGKEVRKN